VIGGQMGAALLTAYTIDGTELPAVTGFEIAFSASAVAALVGAVVAVFVTPPRRRRQRRPVLARSELLASTEGIE
jgi:membrane associated rhomboid family serine protease